MSSPPRRPREAGSAEPFDLAGGVAILTGAAGLLGETWASALAGAGACLALTDLEAESCEERAARLERDAGVRALGIACDVTRRPAWESMVERVEETLGPPTILVNNAGYTNRSRSPRYGASFEDFPVEEWNRILDVNLTGAFLGCQVVGGRMAARGRGSIINIASLYGVVSPHHPLYTGTGQIQPAAYSVSKAGVLGLTRYLATLWARSGVRVNAITPGGVRDDQDERFLERYAERSPAGRMAEPGELAGALLYLASDAASYCTGHNLVVDGGWTVW